MAVPALAAAADPAVPARTSALRAMHMLLLLVQRALQSAAGASGGNSITITDHAVVDAYGAWGSAIGDGGLYSGNGSATTITISGNATVKAETVQSGSAIGAGQHGDSGISRSILKKMPTLPPSVPMTVPRLEIVTVRTVQQPSTLPAAP